MNKKIIYYVLFAIMFILLLCRSRSLGIFILGTVSFHEYNTAFKKDKLGFFATRRPMKRYYERKGKLDKYQKIMFIFFLFCIGLGVYSIIEDLVKIIFS